MPSPSALTVVVAEDDPEAREVFSLVLEVHGYAVLPAENGAVALERIKASKPDVVLTDMMMPVMDGLDLATQLKADAAFAHIPIVLLSAAQLPADFDAPAVFAAMLRKPCAMEALTDAIDMAVNRPAGVGKLFNAPPLSPA